MLNKIKLYFGITLLEAAIYLGISYEKVKSISMYRRTYDLDSLNKLMVLFKALALKTEVSELPHIIDFRSIEKEQTKEPLEKSLRKVKKRLYNQEIALQKKQTKRKTLWRGLNACLELLKEDTLSASDFKWVSLRKKYLEQALTENPYVRELELEAKVYALKNEVTRLEELIMGLLK